MLAIKNNIMAFNAARHLGTNYDALSTSVERLSSGLRINSAKDDAAGLAVRELMRADIRVLKQGSRNAGDGISMLQTMEGAMAIIDENLIRMKELAEQAATGSYSAQQRTIMNAEFEEMANEIERISNNTTFNGIKMLNKSTGYVSIHVGSDETIQVENVNMTKQGLGIDTGSHGYQTTTDFGVTDASADAFITVSDTAAAAGQTASMTIQFDGEDSITIDLASNADGSAKAYTLEEIVELINQETQNLGNDADGNSKNYEMAEIVAGGFTDLASPDSDLSYLKLKSRTGDAGSVSVSINGSTATTQADFAALGATGRHTGNAATDLFEMADDSAESGRFVGASGSGVNVLTVDAAQSALDIISNAIIAKDQARAAFGYKMNRLNSTDRIINIQAENLMTSESRISDVDVATEMAEMTKNQVLAQAGVAMLSQANGIPQMALSLLQR